ncbi:MAG: synthase, partial [Actinomycetota bacterium]|nr:synthase [Actinomycetota bacterium]
MTTETPADFVPTASAISRALKRAETGVTIDATEAETLLLGRGADLDRLLLAAGRSRYSGLEKAGRPGVI